MQSSPSSVPSSSRKRQRRRSTPATPSPSAAPADGSHSAVSDEERVREIYDLLRPKVPPVNSRFITGQTAKRYKLLTPRKFVTQQRLPLADEKLHDVKKVVQKCGLIYTVIDSDSFQLNMVREFVVNLHDAEDRDDGLAVYVRGALVDFSPSLINAMYLIPGFEEDHDYMAEEIDGVCAFLTNNQVRRWENMSSKFLTPLNQVLYKLVCSNWIPTTNYTTITQDRLKFLYMIHHHKSFDFGKLVYNQIVNMSASSGTDKTRRIIFPTLIQQVLQFQRIIPPTENDEEFIGFSKPVVKDKKAGRGSGADLSTASLEEDIDRAIASLKAIRLRLRSKLSFS
ncbi:hypothetical protein N665_0048s0021 [Sinapis alba]|nr:hypothetical protein N665_0048s0021 [Sinapis alba]